MIEYRINTPKKWRAPDRRVATATRQFFFVLSTQAIQPALTRMPVHDAIAVGDDVCGKRKRDDDGVEEIRMKAAYSSKDLLMHMVRSAMDCNIPVVNAAVVTDSTATATTPTIFFPIDDEYENMVEELRFRHHATLLMKKKSIFKSWQERVAHTLFPNENKNRQALQNILKGLHLSLIHI